MTSQAGVVARLRDKSDHYLPDWARGAMGEAADLLESQAKALSEAEAESKRNAEGFAFHAGRAERERSRALAAEARLAEAMKHIDELTADLGAEIEGRYAGIKLYPSEARRYARDIATVVAARAFTNAAKSQESKDA